MTMQEAVIQAWQMLGGAATEDEVADEAARLMMRTMSPEEEAKLVEAELLRVAFEALRQDAPDLTDAELDAMELTRAQVARIAATLEREP